MRTDTRAGLPGSARRLVAESWERARRRRLEPDAATAAVDFVDDGLEEARRSSPLAAAMPVIRGLLTRDADDGSGVVVAVGDAAGRLLWVEGDRALTRRAESMRFMAGADWSEGRVGTSAPGTALALDIGVQIAGAEHFALQVRDWSCTAVPVHDLETHETIGVIDITGGPDVVAPHTLPLLRSTAAAVERELLILRLQRGRGARRPARATRAPKLAVLGRDTAALTVDGRTAALSLRHAELLTLLAWHRGGLSAERLAELVHGRADAVATVRPEMVRLRHVLAGVAPTLVPLASPTGWRCRSTSTPGRWSRCWIGARTTPRSTPARDPCCPPPSPPASRRSGGRWRRGCASRCWRAPPRTSCCCTPSDWPRTTPSP